LASVSNKSQSQLVKFERLSMEDL